MNKNYGLGLAALLALGANGCCKKEMVEEPQTVLLETKKEEPKKEEKPALVSGFYTGTINFNGKELQVTYDIFTVYSEDRQDCSLVLSKFTSIDDKKLYSLKIADEKCDGKAESLSLCFQHDYGSFVGPSSYETAKLNEQELKETGYDFLAARLLAAGKEVIKEENSEEYKERQNKLKERQKESEELNRILYPLTN